MRMLDFVLCVYGQMLYFEIRDQAELRCFAGGAVVRLPQQESGGIFLAPRLEGCCPRRGNS